jgi:hypothetical protein
VSQFSVYNKQRPEEERFITLKLNFGVQENFEVYNRSYIINQVTNIPKTVFSMFEGYVICFLREIDASQAFHQLVSRDYTAIDEFFFVYRYLTDRLIYYGTREHAGEGCLQLANLMFSSIFTSRVFLPFIEGKDVVSHAWPENLSKWVCGFFV